MLTEKTTKKNALLAVAKNNAKIIQLNKQPAKADLEKDQKPLRPPLTRFNTRYLKGKDKDPL
ncbi:MAG: hypothetical protein ABIU63_10185 [Chitinophagaceae bacterium]